jgi:hypothetical protein
MLTRAAHGLDLAHSETISLIRAERALCSGILQSAQPEEHHQCILDDLLVALARSTGILQPRPAYERLIQRDGDLAGCHSYLRIPRPALREGRLDKAFAPPLWKSIRRVLPDAARRVHSDLLGVAAPGKGVFHCSSSSCRDGRGHSFRQSLRASCHSRTGDMDEYLTLDIATGVAQAK